MVLDILYMYMVHMVLGSYFLVLLGFDNRDLLDILNLNDILDLVDILVLLGYDMLEFLDNHDLLDYDNQVHLDSSKWDFLVDRHRKVQMKVYDKEYQRNDDDDLK